MAEIEIVNQSAVSQLLKCEQQWAFRQRLGPKAPNAALTFGTAFHSGFGVNYAQKIQTGTDLPWREVTDIAVTDLELRKDSTIWDEDSFVDAKDQMPGVVEVFHRDAASKVHPIGVEEKIEVAFRDVPWIFRGYVDVREVQGTLVDTKTASRSWSEDRPLHEWQPLAYGLAEPEEPSLFRFDIAVKTRIPKVQRLERWVSPEEKRGFLLVLQLAKKRMDAILASHDELPKGYGGPLCSKKFCGYWQECQAKWKLPIRD